MSATGIAAVPTPTPTDRHRLDETLSRLRDGARAWASRPLAARIAHARAMLAGAARVAERSVAAACAAKGLAPATPPAGDEWISSPYVTHRILRQTVRSLVMLERNGNTPVGKLDETEDGRLTVRVFPANRLDALLFIGLAGDVHLEAGVGAAELHRTRARFYKERDHDGKVCLVLGAGNVNSIPAADVVAKMFIEGKACVLKMNPVNAYMGPLLEEAFADAIAPGFLAVVYGGGEEGSYLAHHPAVDEVHITGSDKTHDAIVWGPPGPERAARLARKEPLLQKPITSELGNITPVIVVPGAWSDRELSYQAESVAGMVTQNASFNCNAGKVLVTPRGWAMRDRFLALVMEKLGATPARKAWYPGAETRYATLTAGRGEIRRLSGGEGTLPWTIVTGLDAADPAEKAFTMEPFCSVLSETQVGSADPVEFLDAAARFANERLWGTLSVMILACGKTLGDAAARGAVERAIRTLRYGSVAVNVWSGLAYASGTGPWGAYPGSTLEDVQSGRGFVHNTRMLERVEKLVFRAPAWSPLKLPYFPTHRTAHELGRRLAELEVDGSWRKLPGIVGAAVRG
ncbi:MAG: aldehyde dehydrogenase family protein [Anaeromyxobacteraceae bacterium]